LGDWSHGSREELALDLVRVAGCASFVVKSRYPLLQGKLVRKFQQLVVGAPDLPHVEKPAKRGVIQLGKAARVTRGREPRLALATDGCLRVVFVLKIKIVNRITSSQSQQLLFLGFFLVLHRFDHVSLVIPGDLLRFTCLAPLSRFFIGVESPRVDFSHLLEVCRCHTIIVPAFGNLCVDGWRLESTKDKGANIHQLLPYMDSIPKIESTKDKGANIHQLLPYMDSIPKIESTKDKGANIHQLLPYMDSISYLSDLHHLLQHFLDRHLVGLLIHVVIRLDKGAELV
jgi:hypothetical protein